MTNGSESKAWRGESGACARGLVAPSTAGSHRAGSSGAVRGHQSRRAVGGHRASLRGVLEPVLEAARRVAAGPRANHLSGRSATARVGARHHEPHRAAHARDRRSASGRVRRQAGTYWSERSPGSGRQSWRWSASRCTARSCPQLPAHRLRQVGSARRPNASVLGLRPGTDSRRPRVRAAEPERPQRELQLRRDARGVPSARCTPSAITPRHG